MIRVSKAKILSLILIVLLSLSATQTQAAGVGPASQSYIYGANGNSSGGYTIYTPIFNNPGIVTNHPNSASGIVDPIAITMNQLSVNGLKALLTYGLGKQVASLDFSGFNACYYSVQNLDTHDFVPGLQASVTASGLNLLSFSGTTVNGFKVSNIPELSAGNYQFRVKCLTTSNNIFEDFNDFYVVPDSTSLSPENYPPFIVSTLPSNSEDGYTVNFNINSDPGIVSEDQYVAALNPTGAVTILPLAFTADGLNKSSISMIISTPSLLQGIANIFAGSPYIENCNFYVTNLATGNSAYSQQITASPISTQALSLPMSLIPGNYKIGTTCNLSDSKSIEDFNYIYIPPATPSCSSPSVTLSPSGPQTANSCTPVSETVQYTTSSGGSGGSCTGSRGGSIPIDSSGSFSTGAVSPGSTYTYGITCTNSCGQSASANGSFTVVQPQSQTTTNQTAPYVDIKAQ